MSEIPTPRTDAQNFKDEYGWKRWAEQLERELSEAYEELNKIRYATTAVYNWDVWNRAKAMETK